MEIPVTVCDVCKAVGKPTRHYELRSSDGRSRSGDLCEAHGAILEGMLGSAPTKRVARKATSAPVKRTRKRGTPEIVTFSDIERMKAQA